MKSVVASNFVFPYHSDFATWKEKVYHLSSTKPSTYTDLSITQERHSPTESHPEALSKTMQLWGKKNRHREIVTRRVTTKGYG